VAAWEHNLAALLQKQFFWGGEEVLGEVITSVNRISRRLKEAAERFQRVNAKVDMDIFPWLRYEIVTRGGC
jgi:hypothetical protein